MEVKTRAVGEYWAYCCPRCVNGTMAWEHDKAGEPPFLKCVLCGKEVHENNKKSGEKSSRKPDFEAKAGDKEPEKQDKKDYKWRFSHAQK